MSKDQRPSGMPLPCATWDAVGTYGSGITGQCEFLEDQAPLYDEGAIRQLMMDTMLEMANRFRAKAQSSLLYGHRLEASAWEEAANMCIDRAVKWGE